MHRPDPPCDNAQAALRGTDVSRNGRMTEPAAEDRVRCHGSVPRTGWVGSTVGSIGSASVTLTPNQAVSGPRDERLGVAEESACGPPGLELLHELDANGLRGERGGAGLASIAVSPKPRCTPHPFMPHPASLVSREENPKNLQKRVPISQAVKELPNATLPMPLKRLPSKIGSPCPSASTSLLADGYAEEEARETTKSKDCAENRSIANFPVYGPPVPSRRAISDGPTTQLPLTTGCPATGHGSSGSGRGQYRAHDDAGSELAADGYQSAVILGASLATFEFGRGRSESDGLVDVDSEDQSSGLTPKGRSEWWGPHAGGNVPGAPPPKALEQQACEAPVGLLNGCTQPLCTGILSHGLASRSDTTAAGQRRSSETQSRSPIAIVSFPATHVEQQQLPLNDPLPLKSKGKVHGQLAKLIFGSSSADVADIPCFSEGSDSVTSPGPSRGGVAGPTNKQSSGGTRCDENLVPAGHRTGQWRQGCVPYASEFDVAHPPTFMIDSLCSDEMTQCPLHFLAACPRGAFHRKRSILSNETLHNHLMLVADTVSQLTTEKNVVQRECQSLHRELRRQRDTIEALFRISSEQSAQIAALMGKQHHQSPAPQGGAAADGTPAKRCQAFLTNTAIGAMSCHPQSPSLAFSELRPSGGRETKQLAEEIMTPCNVTLVAYPPNAPLGAGGCEATWLVSGVALEEARVGVARSANIHSSGAAYEPSAVAASGPALCGQDPLAWKQRSGRTSSFQRLRRVVQEARCAEANGESKPVIGRGASGSAGGAQIQRVEYRPVTPQADGRPVAVLRNFAGASGNSHAVRELSPIPHERYLRTARGDESDVASFALPSQPPEGVVRGGAASFLVSAPQMDENQIEGSTVSNTTIITIDTPPSSSSSLSHEAFGSDLRHRRALLEQGAPARSTERYGSRGPPRASVTELISGCVAEAPGSMWPEECEHHEPGGEPSARVVKREAGAEPSGSPKAERDGGQQRGRTRRKASSLSAHGQSTKICTSVSQTPARRERAENQRREAGAAIRETSGSRLNPHKVSVGGLQPRLRRGSGAGTAGLTGGNLSTVVELARQCGSSLEPSHARVTGVAVTLHPKPETPSVLGTLSDGLLRSATPQPSSIDPHDSEANPTEKTFAALTRSACSMRQRSPGQLNERRSRGQVNSRKSVSDCSVTDAEASALVATPDEGRTPPTDGAAAAPGGRRRVHLPSLHPLGKGHARRAPPGGTPTPAGDTPPVAHLGKGDTLQGVPAPPTEEPPPVKQRRADGAAGPGITMPAAPAARSPADESPEGDLQPRPLRRGNSESAIILRLPTSALRDTGTSMISASFASRTGCAAAEKLTGCHRWEDRCEDPPVHSLRAKRECRLLYESATPPPRQQPPQEPGPLSDVLSPTAAVRRRLVANKGALTEVAGLPTMAESPGFSDLHRPLRDGEP